MRRALALLGALLLAGCGGSEPGEVAGETAQRLGELRSGVLDLELTVEGAGGDAEAGFGFTLEGPFALPERDGLPVADVRYTQSVGELTEEVAVVSTGERAWVDGRELTDEQAARLRLAGGAGNPLAGLELGRWMIDPELSDAGEGLERVSGRLDAGAALDDVTRLLGGEGLPDAERERLTEASESSRLTIVTGADDRLLRRLDADLRVELAVARSLQSALGELVGGRVRLTMEIEAPNEPVEVRAPR